MRLLNTQLKLVSERQIRQGKPIRITQHPKPFSANVPLLRCETIESSGPTARSRIGATAIFMSRVPRRRSSRGIAAKSDTVYVAYLTPHVGRFRCPTVASFPSHERPFGCRASEDVVLGGLG